MQACLVVGRNGSVLACWLPARMTLHKVSGWPVSWVSVQPRRSRPTLSRRSVTRLGREVCLGQQVGPEASFEASQERHEEAEEENGNFTI